MEPAEPTNRLRVARSIATVVALLSGAGLVTYGAWHIYMPAGIVVAGLFLLAEGLNEARR